MRDTSVWPSVQLEFKQKNSIAGQNATQNVAPSRLYLNTRTW